MITLDMLVWAYSHGYFPMADARHGEVGWYSPDPRAIIPLEDFHVSRSLRKRTRRGDYRITIDQAFASVIRTCADVPRDEHDTWINDEIIESYIGLHEIGVTHSVEAWQTSDTPGDQPTLVGGLYGVALGGAFCGESMFSLATDASKVCLVHLVDHLRERGFRLLDTQFQNPHMMQFGLIEIPREEYLQRLAAAIRLDVQW